MADAKAVFEQAKQRGKEDAFDDLEQRLASSVNTKSDMFQDPPQDHIQSLINLQSNGKYQQALNQASQLLKKFPKSVILWNINGCVS